EHGIAQSIERTLWSFGRRWYQRRRIRTFRDESNLAAQPDLWPTIENAIRESNCLVLLASPDSARSEWVPREVEAFVSQHGIQGLCLVQTEGELPWNSNLSSEEIFSNRKAAITERMWRMFVDAGAELIVVDLRRFRSMLQRQLTRNPEYMSAIAAIAA